MEVDNRRTCYRHAIFDRQIIPDAHRSRKTHREAEVILIWLFISYVRLPESCILPEAVISAALTWRIMGTVASANG